MAFELSEVLVVGVASSALFDLRESDSYFRANGEAAYRTYQDERIDQPRLRVSIVTARNAPARERAIRSLEKWGLEVNDAFFLGGIAKDKVLRVLKPHVFFDDQLKHLQTAVSDVAAVHVPFGVVNALADPTVVK